MQKLTACLDSNVYISALAFGGKPLKVLEKAFNREFHLVSGTNILQEVKKNLITKLDLKKSRVERFMEDITAVSSMFVPSGNLKFIDHAKDNLVIEIALMGGSDVLVTGDKKHLLPLGNIQGIYIQPPSAFLARLELIK